MKAISIDKPCNENWAEMTPSQQGAFCGKCQIDVVDFSNKSPLEVKLILQENVGKHMCGRFKKTQLDEINLDYSNWETQSLRVFQSKFVYALVVVFGMTLFSCHGPDEIIMGDFEAPHELSDSTSHQQNLDRIEMEGSFMNYGASAEIEKDSIKKNIDEQKHIKGKVAYNYNEEENLPEVIQVNTTNVINEEEYIKGDYAYSPPDTLKIEPVVINTVQEREVFVLGEMVYIDPIQLDPVTIDTSQNKTTIVDEVSVEPNPTIISESNFAVKLFPNPTADVAMVVVEINETSHFKIELFDVNGQLLARIHNGRLSTGPQQFAISMHAYAPGTYVLVVAEANSTQTVKIQKVN